MTGAAALGGGGTVLPREAGRGTAHKRGGGGLRQ
jgi:hypothetical protein